MHDHSHEEQTTGLRAFFKKASRFIGKNKASISIGGAALLATTALATPLLTTTAGAFAALAAGLGIMALASDVAIHGVEHIGIKRGISPLMMGIIGLGALHSIPELAVALWSVASGAADLALGNLVGANVAHIFLILGATAAIAGVKKGIGASWAFNTKAMIGATAALGGLLATGMLTPVAGAGMLAAAGLYLYGNVQTAKKDAKLLGKKVEDLIHSHDHGDEDHCCSAEHDHSHDHDHDHHEHEHGHHHHDNHSHDHKDNGKKWDLKEIFLAVAGMGALVGASHIVVDSGIELAQKANISEAAIGALALAFGTSLPELTSNINLALKRKTDMAIGNILGCNIYNILFIGGVLSFTNTEVPPAFSPDTTQGLFNLAALVGSAAYMGFLLRGKGEITKKQGYATMVAYGGYCAATYAMGSTAALAPHI